MNACEYVIGVRTKCPFINDSRWFKLTKIKELKLTPITIIVNMFKFAMFIYIYLLSWMIKSTINLLIDQCVYITSFH